MDPVASSTAADVASAAPSGTANTGAAGSTAFHDDLAKAAEKLQPVKGHGYSKVKSGGREGMYVNRSHNGRDGQTFEIVHRAGRVWHAYEQDGKRVCVELPSAAKAALKSGAADAKPTQ